METKSAMQRNDWTGRMGANMVRGLLMDEHQCVAFDRSADAVKELVNEKALGAASLADLVKKLAKPRAVWADGTRWGRG